jgi:hypothetical protein
VSDEWACKLVRGHEGSHSFDPPTSDDLDVAAVRAEANETLVNLKNDNSLVALGWKNMTYTIIALCDRLTASEALLNKTDVLLSAVFTDAMHALPMTDWQDVEHFLRRDQPGSPYFTPPPAPSDEGGEG